MAKLDKNNKSDNYNLPFPTILRDLLSETNTSQEELAKVIGVKRQTISTYQNGVTTPDIYIFKKIIEYFNTDKNQDISYDYWLGDTKFKSRKNLDIKELGLNDNVIEKIKEFKGKKTIKCINAIIEQKDSEVLFEEIVELHETIKMLSEINSIVIENAKIYKSYKKDENDYSGYINNINKIVSLISSLNQLNTKYILEDKLKKLNLSLIVLKKNMDEGKYSNEKDILISMYQVCDKAIELSEIFQSRIDLLEFNVTKKFGKVIDEMEMY